MFASLNNRMIGIVTFEVTDRQPEPVPPPPVIAKDSDEDKVGVDTEIPTIVREEEDGVG